MVLAAIEHWHSKTRIRFWPRTTESDYVKIVIKHSGGGGQSAIGRRGGIQVIPIDTGSILRGALIHELAHAAGMFHEHNRPDRNQFVKVTSKKSSLCRREERNHGRPYDCHSTMAYESDPGFTYIPGACEVSGHGLSAGDIKGIGSTTAPSARRSRPTTGAPGGLQPSSTRWAAVPTCSSSRRDRRGGHPSRQSQRDGGRPGRALRLDERVDLGVLLQGGREALHVLLEEEGRHRAHPPGELGWPGGGQGGRVPVDERLDVGLFLRGRGPIVHVLPESEGRYRAHPSGERRWHGRRQGNRVRLDERLDDGLLLRGRGPAVHVVPQGKGRHRAHPPDRDGRHGGREDRPT
jgi:hypothetical protein